MPTYEYLCETNGRVLEVHHKMAERLKTWGELCARAGVSPGRTDPGVPVMKLMSAGFVGTKTEGACEAPYCGSGECASSACGSGPCSWGDD